MTASVQVVRSSHSVSVELRESFAGVIVTVVMLTVGLNSVVMT